MKRLRPAVELEGALLDREVSCGIFPGVFAAAEAAGVDLEDLVAGTGFPLSHFNDSTERVSWAALQLFGERIGRLWSETELRAIGAQSLEVQHFEPQIFLARLLLRPTEAYAFIIRGDSQGDFACLEARTTVDGQHVDIEISISDGYGHCPSLMWIFCGAAEAAPGIFGLPNATVEMTLHDRGAHLSVEVPPGGGRWSWVERIRHGVWRPRRLEAVGDRLSQRTTALETQIAKRLTVEADLKAALDEHDRRLASLNDVIVEIDADETVSFVSSNISAVLGLDEEAFCSDPWRFLQPPDGDVSVSWIADVSRSGRWFEINPSRYSDSGSTALLLVVREVTDRVELAEKTSGASRLESLGVMAAGVAHDFNNLLVPIGINAESVLEDLSPSSPIHDRVLAIQRAAQMASQLTDQILVSTGQPIPIDGSCDVVAVLRSMMPVLVAVVPDAVDVQFDLGPPARAAVDEESLSKLVTNLVVNAGQAIDGAGTVRLVVESTVDAVVVKVIDDGSGMAPNTVARMSEPFFTTRSGGRGLGLASLAGLLQRGTASLDVASVIGEGTTITVAFEALPAEAPKTADETPNLVGSCDVRILLIDDDDLVRRTIHRLLERSFTSVESVPKAADAVALLTAGASIDCVISDLTMPEIGGPELIVDLRAVQPELPAILITGAGRDRAMDELERAGLTDVSVLQKPFSPHELLEAVSNALPPVPVR